MAQKSLFDQVAQEQRARVAPLATRMRPETLDDFVGQEQIVGPDTWLRRVISHDTLSSILLYGPAGTGKTSLALIIAHVTNGYFEEVSAVTGTVSDLRKAIESASQRLAIQGQRTILFIDEIHRFSKSQQDALLHAVEDRVVVLVGATTENPYFEVNAPLVSRSRVIELEPLSDDDIIELVDKALDNERGLAGRYQIDDGVVTAIAMTAGGDARVALTTLELAAQLADHLAEDTMADPTAQSTITLHMVSDVLPSRILPYDKSGDTHYDVISAFIKSMRGSDVDATIYWLARMIHGGEDPKFIARRIMIFASEDVGNADPQALLIAHAAFRATETIGMPECRINLAQAASYMALAPKSNSAYLAIDDALREVREGPARFVPNHLRDRHRPGSERYGTYLYPHSYTNAWIEQQYLPQGLEHIRFYKPNKRGWESEVGSQSPGQTKHSNADTEE